MYVSKLYNKLWGNRLVRLPLQAKDELNETDEKRVSAVKELRGTIKEKAEVGDDLAKGVQDTFGEKPDSLLVRFIRARKYDVPRAYDLMKGTLERMFEYTDSIFPARKSQTPDYITWIQHKRKQ